MPSSNPNLALGVHAGDAENCHAGDVRDFHRAATAVLGEGDRDEFDTQDFADERCECPHWAAFTAREDRLEGLTLAFVCAFVEVERNLPATGAHSTLGMNGHHRVQPI